MDKIESSIIYEALNPYAPKENIVTSQSWGTKRNCPNCSTHFYDLNKTPATCPKCKHQFEPAAPVRAKRKPARRTEEADMAGKHITVLPPVKKGESKKDKKPPIDTEGAGEDIVELEDDAEAIQDLSELEEREEEVVNEDDADDETSIEAEASEKLVSDVEEEEASALADDDEDEKGSQKKKAKKKP